MTQVQTNGTNIKAYWVGWQSGGDDPDHLRQTPFVYHYTGG